MPKVYGWESGFALADASCVVRRQNKAPGGDDGVDQQTQAKLIAAAGADRDHGICGGITSTWVIGFLGNRSEATKTDEFKAYFSNVLQFQGAYMKEIGGKADLHIEKLLDKAHFDAGIKKIKTVKSNVISPDQMPSGSWAAYSSVWHHAIGIGHKDGKYYIMEPNFGLYVYNGPNNFHLDFQNLIEARRNRKNKTQQDQVSVYFYGHS